MQVRKCGTIRVFHAAQHSISYLLTLLVSVLRGRETRLHCITLRAVLLHTVATLIWWQ
jgi:hypothetical protein